MAYIEIKDLTYCYPLEKKMTLKDINLDIDRGDMLLIIGKSGSGKSTLGKALTGAVPDFYGGSIKGSIKINKQLLSDMKAYERAKEVTMVFQEPEKQLMMNKVHKEIAFGLENVGTNEKTIKRRVWEAMQFCNITSLAHRDIQNLSGGEKQRVAIAAALAYSPSCIILDEPISQLDPLNAEDVVNLVKKINEELGITIIVIEQRINKWFDFSNKIAFMEDGCIKEFQNKKDIINYFEAFDFLPDYIKVFKELEFFPDSFFSARKYIEKINLNKTQNKKIKAINNEEIINIKKLNVFYDKTQVINNVSLNVKKGECIAIMGANGAGKSTLLKAIMGLIKYKGSIRVSEKEVSSTNIKDIAKIIGYVAQNPNDYLSKDTVYNELKFTLDNFKNKNTENIEKVLCELDLTKLQDKNPRDLSGGEKQRVAIASVLVNEPSVLILDEPTRGIDVYLKEKLKNILKDLNNKGITVILVTHDTEFAAGLCQRFILMFNQEVMCDGDIGTVMGESIYYTTFINKLFRLKDKSIFTLNDALNAIGNRRDI